METFLIGLLSWVVWRLGQGQCSVKLHIVVISMGLRRGVLRAPVRMGLGHLPLPKWIPVPTGCFESDTRRPSDEEVLSFRRGILLLAVIEEARFYLRASCSVLVGRVSCRQGGFGARCIADAVPELLILLLPLPRVLGSQMGTVLPGSGVLFLKCHQKQLYGQLCNCVRFKVF